MTQWFWKKTFNLFSANLKSCGPILVIAGTIVWPAFEFPEWTTLTLKYSHPIMYVFIHDLPTRFHFSMRIAYFAHLLHTLDQVRLFVWYLQVTQGCDKLHFKDRFLKLFRKNRDLEENLLGSFSLFLLTLPSSLTEKLFIVSRNKRLYHTLRAPIISWFVSSLPFDIVKALLLSYEILFVLKT